MSIFYNIMEDILMISHNHNENYILRLSLNSNSPYPPWQKSTLRMMRGNPLAPNQSAVTRIWFMNMHDMWQWRISKNDKVCHVCICKECASRISLQLCRIYIYISYSVTQIVQLAKCCIHIYSNIQPLAIWPLSALRSRKVL